MKGLDEKFSQEHSTSIQQSLHSQLMLFVPLALPTQRPGVHGYMGYCVKLSLVMSCRQKSFFNKGNDNPISLHCVSSGGHGWQPAVFEKKNPPAQMHWVPLCAVGLAF